jgi:hypothetical protein
MLLVAICPATQYNIPEYFTLQQNLCENLKSDTNIIS